MEIKPLTTLDRIFELEKERKELSNRLKKDFYKVLKPFFDKCEDIKTISWDQASPYDDSSYNFSVMNIAINGIGENTDWDDEEDEAKIAECEALYDRVPHDLVEEIMDLIESVPEDIMENMFGNDIRVIITRDGKVNEEDCYIYN